MNLKGRVDKIEVAKQPAFGVRVCFQKSSQTLEETKKEVLKNDVVEGDWLVVRWLD